MISAYNREFEKVLEALEVLRKRVKALRTRKTPSPLKSTIIKTGLRSKGSMKLAYEYDPEDWPSLGWIGHDGKRVPELPGLQCDIMFRMLEHIEGVVDDDPDVRWIWEDESEDPEDVIAYRPSTRQDILDKDKHLNGESL